MASKDEFLKDITEGLASTPKRISSKYFYDEAGDKLFHYIMNQPEYYLTCAEYEILQTYSEEIVALVDAPDKLRIIEPGAGDGLKTKVLLDTFLKNTNKLIYNPIDISRNVLDILCNSMTLEYPQLLCEPVTADYFQLKNEIPDDDSKRLMLFLGSNIGNFSYEESVEIMDKFTKVLEPGHFFMVGVDLVKNPNRILAAYNDANGVTAEFNYNLLTRINRELGGNFKKENFVHYPVYNPVEQQAESYLMSKISQNINIGDNEYHFAAWEPVLTEVSRKYTSEKIHQLANYSGFKVIRNFHDVHHDFCCSLWQKV